MPTADEYLKTDMGNLVSQLMVQNAVLKAEVDRLKNELLKQAVAGNGQPAPVEPA